ncbi:nitrate reductase molybdenum cofactor assembly chaperone [Actinomycetospora rhizophila]|uniref:Nitrate reductase molybdenum cofactor assembly chaperone n=1 Tax=Actinomycetospora rhizophila TaxID=1416876 RepID=A0ABV9ZGQ3_9PSEU
MHQVASWCLSYPDAELTARLPLLRDALAERPRGPAVEALEPVVAHLLAGGPGTREREYVETFDLSRRHALHLSYWTDGDTRRRGEVLAGFVERYRRHGFRVDAGRELPDFLPLVLEYAALADPVDGAALLQEYRPSLELLRLALTDDASPYAGAVTAVCATLPGVSPPDRAAVHAMAAAGPPAETVGLDPYDPRLLPLEESR